MNNDSDSALQFPCSFPIKAMGLAIHDMEIIVGGIVREHAPDTTEDAFSRRASANGKYISITVIVNAQSREQLDAIYQALTDHEHVIMAL
jgi:putative lipoic acid-binding regulatory protein